MRTRLLVIALLAACRPQVAENVEGSLAFDPAELELGDVYEGHLRAHELDLVLASAAGCDEVRLSIPAGFTVDEGTSLSLSGSERRRLTVRPPASGLRLHQGTLTASGCGLTASVKLSARLVPRPACTSSSSCRSARFDPGAGSCVEDSAADGTPCSEACLTSAACRAGECRGAAKSCDDSDPCTLDVCSAEAGCQNVPAGLLCPPPAQCASACLGPTCPRGDAQLLWSLQTQDELGASQLAADDDGNLYWLESTEQSGGPFTTTLASATAGGRVRYRRTSPYLPGNYTSLAPMVVRDVVLLSPAGFGGRVAAYRRTDGQLLWETRLQALAGLSPSVLAWGQHGAAVGDGSVVFAVTWGAAAPTPGMLLSIEPDTARLGWKQHEAVALWSVAPDEERNLYIARKLEPVHSRENGGRMRFTTATDTLSAVAAGRAYGAREAVSTADGKVSYRFGDVGYVWVADDELGVRTTQTGPLELFRTTDGSLRGTVDLGKELLQDAMLTQAGGVLLVSAESGMPPVLRGVDADGTQQFSCRLPGAGPYSGSGVLHDGRYYALEQPTQGGKGTLRAFLVAGQSLAKRGWVTHDATPARTRRPATGP